jgi:hypothetical protein
MEDSFGVKHRGWLFGKPEVIHVEPISNEKSACRQEIKR